MSKKILVILFLVLVFSALLYLLLTKKKERTAQVFVQAPFSLTSGEYVVKVKGPVERRIVFCKEGQDQGHVCKRTEYFNIKDGENALDLTGHPLDFGDINQDGAVGVTDYSFVKDCRIKNSVMASRGGDGSYEAGCNLADGNFDGVVDHTDVDLLYKTLSTKPDDE